MVTKISFDDLNGKVCVFTGGTGVLGASLVRALASAGVKTAIIARNKEATEQLATQIEKDTGVKTIGVSASVLDREALIAAKKEINEKLGKINFLINGAGGNAPTATTQLEEMTVENTLQPEKTFYGLDLDGFQHVFDLNFKGTLLPTMIFTTDMLEAGKGCVLNISSMAAYKALTKVAAYSAAKASINNFTEWLAVHLAKTGIRVNAVAPGFFLTNQNRFLLTDEKTGEPTPRGLKIKNNTPMGKYGEPQDLSGAVLFLLSDISSFVTGICIPVDGGFNAYAGV